jgi:hypothetical protein
MQRNFTQLITCAAITAVIASAPIHAQARQVSTDDTFTWSGQMAAGSELRVRNLAGNITVTRATGNVVEIRGEKQWRDGNSADVRFELVRDGNDVTICAVWFNGRCESGSDYNTGDSGRRGRNQSTDVTVRFTIALPAGVRLSASGVSSDVSVTGATAGVSAASVSGNVSVSESAGSINAASVSGNVEVDADRVGALKANSVSGHVNANIRSLVGSEALSFNSVSGSVTVSLPADVGAEIEMATLSGTMRSDFPITTHGTNRRGSIQGTIGDGGRKVTVNTVSGSVTLTRS